MAAFLDTNILVYSVVSADSRQRPAQALLQQGGVISVQVLNEFANVAARKLKMPWQDIDRSLVLIRQLCQGCVPLTLAVHTAAIGIAARYAFAFYDCLIVAAALEAGCDTLLTEDMNHGQVIENRLTLRNPFA